MNLQSFVVFLTASLAFVNYAQACTIFYNGAFRHQTGDKGGGCFGTDPSDNITSISTDPPTACYVLYTDWACKGTQLTNSTNGTQFCDGNSFPKGIKFSSVRLTCPPGT
ncbi:9547_t:CDS:2 [Ambispora gerdemannii]|uniref:9547_t:CDS:1 n=1 Tax=Ambispora gerdemannii TaxID=144530 RepID=A0A9N8YQW7_9GLOM|nr:9547_t:CDS:2 [Ambispora gerdemannii]